MRMEIGLSQALLQKQILSPQMIQSMEILVLNNLQLEERIEKELEENIALELVEPNSSGEVESSAAETSAQDGAPALESAAKAASTSPEAAIDGVDLDRLRDRYERLSEFQAEEYYTAPSRSAVGGAGDEDEKLEMLQNTPSRPESLQDHLVDQIRLRTDLSEREQALIHEVIFNLDERGYLRFPIEEIAAALNAALPVANSSAEGAPSPVNPDPTASTSPREELSGRDLLPPVSTHELQKALSIVQSLDPSGVGATDLKNCLLIQLDHDAGEYPLERKLIENHLEDIARNRLPQIARSTGSSLEAVKDAIEIIRSLNPLPGKNFAARANSYLRPDVIIYEDAGDYKVRVENESLPKLRISPRYRELLDRSKDDPEIRKYIKRKIDNAEFLLHAIQQRGSTLHRVAEEIVKNQQEFFKNGPRFLKPLKMQQVADAVGVNVSTVSRAISGKYFQSPDYIKELKYLFTGGTVKEDGTMEARGSVIQRIHDLVNAEDKRRPLSDSRIVTMLRREGINISRRTVTKYREAESIPSSRERRSF